MEIALIPLFVIFMIFAILAALDGNFVPVLIIVRFIRLIIWLEIVNKINHPSSEADYCKNLDNLEDKQQFIEVLRVLTYLVAYMGFFPYDLAAYKSISFIVMRISIMAGISYLVNSLKLLSCKEKTPTLIKYYLWRLPLREVASITVMDLLFTFSLSV